MRQVLFFEFWHSSPHLETAFELAKKHIALGDDVHFYFGGHELTYCRHTRISPDNRFVRLGMWKLPEARGAKLLRGDSFHFYPRLDFSAVSIEPSIPDILTMEDLKGFTYRGYNAGLSVLSSLVSETRCSTPDLSEYGLQVKTMLADGAKLFECVSSIINEQQADLVYVFNGRFYECRAVLDAARSLDVPVKIHERGATIDRYSLRDFMPHDRLKIQSELLALWDSANDDAEALDVASNFFRERKNGVEQAWKSFTANQMKDELPPLEPGKRIITYFSSSDDEYVAVGDIYKWEGWEDQFSAVLDLITICSELPETALIIRIHPHLVEKSSDDQEKWMSLAKYQDVVLIPPDSKVDSYALLDSSDLVVSAGSTIGIEAVFWGKPSVNLGPSLYSELHATFQPKGKRELSELLRRKSLEVYADRSLPYGYYMSVFGNLYRDYEPKGILEGRFMGVDLMAVPFTVKLIRNIRGILAGMREPKVPPGSRHEA